MQNGGQTYVIVMDFWRAFHKLHLRKELLSTYAIYRYTLGWIQDVLNNRQQCVILEAEKSGFINVGPILFLAFINGGLTKLQTGQKAKLVYKSRPFADDFVVKSLDDCSTAESFTEFVA